MKSYLFVFNGKQVSRAYVTSRLDAIGEVTDWIAFFDNACCLVTDLAPSELGEAIRRKLPDVQFIVADIGGKNGWLPRSVWDFINGRAPADTSSVA